MFATGLNLFLLHCVTKFKYVNTRISLKREKNNNSQFDGSDLVALWLSGRVRNDLLRLSTHNGWL